MLQYKIPQNVGIEDKIVGPLTLRQLIILAIGGGTSYVLFAILNKIYELNALEYIVIALPALIAAAAALIKINNLSFSKFVLLTLEYNMKPKKRVWDHRGIASLVDPNLYSEPTSKKTKSENKASSDTQGKSMNLADLSRILDSGGRRATDENLGHDDIDSADDQDLVPQAFFGKREDETGNMYWRANKHDRGKRLELLAKLPQTKPKSAESSESAELSAPTPLATEEVPPQENSPKIDIKVEAKEPVFEIELEGDEPEKEAVQLDTIDLDLGDSEPVTKPKKRKRKRKKKTSKIARPETHVNTTEAKKPAQFIPKESRPDASDASAASPKADPKPPNKAPAKESIPDASASTPKNPKEGEFEFKELQQGEIEINLND